MRQVFALGILAFATVLFGSAMAEAQCNSCEGDLNRDDRVTVDELVKAVNSALTGCVYNPTIDPANFVAAVSNPYFPLVPGTTFRYRSEDEEITVSVTHDTKVILGVTCTVVHDVAMVDGETAEDTFDWYAQDKDGNVWYFGEDTKAFENGQVSTEGSFEAGVDGAKPGIVIEGHPMVGDTYRQEYAPGVAEDRGEVLSLTESVTVAFGSFTNCLKTKDFTDLEPNHVENKVFCPNVGQVLAVAVQGGSDREELVSITHE
jgi:hypothetical protein